MDILPQPAHLELLSGAFTLLPGAVIQPDPAALGTARQLAEWLRPATGFALPVVADADAPAIRLIIRAERGELGAEGYELEVLPGGVTLSAHAPAGLFYAAQSLRQLLPPAIFAPSTQLISTQPASTQPLAAQPVTWSIPAQRVQDRPRFGWRGQHLDCARHFMPLDFIYRLLDLMALHKLNTFHWHLTDDQGWRLEIKQYPRLTEVGAWRSGTWQGHARDPQGESDQLRYGGFYTQAEARSVVAYAARLHITVVPEIEMPGHAQAAIAAYVQLGNTGQALEVGQRWGVIEHVFNAEEPTLLFLQQVLDEVLDIFPGQYIHVGGDECPKTEWKNSPAAQARIRALNLKDEDALQAYIIGRMDRFLQQRGRTLIGWDEILEGGLAPHAAVMSWRGEEGGVEAARQGHDVVMVPYTHVYFDLAQSEEASEPLSIGGFTPLAKVYAYEPVPAELSAEQAGRVLGSQGQLWTEYVPTTKHAEYLLFPRLCALSEVLWTPAEDRDYAAFLPRLSEQLERLRWLGVKFRALDGA